MALVQQGSADGSTALDPFWSTVPASTEQSINHLAELIVALSTACHTFRQQKKTWTGPMGDYDRYAREFVASEAFEGTRQRFKQTTEDLARVLGTLIPSLGGSQTLTQTLGRLTTGDRTSTRWGDLQHAVRDLPISLSAKSAMSQAYKSAITNRIIKKDAVKEAVKELKSMSTDPNLCLFNTEGWMGSAAKCCKKWLGELREEAERFETSVLHDPASWTESGVIYQSLQHYLNTHQGQRDLRHLCKEVIKIDLAWDLLQHAVAGGAEFDDDGGDRAYHSDLEYSPE